MEDVEKSKEGFVYVWRVPNRIEIIIEEKKYFFYIVKVGISKWENLFKRLYDETVAWKKLLARKKDSSKFEITTYPKIPNTTRKAARTWYDLTWDELKKKFHEDDFLDVGCFLSRDGSLELGLLDAEYIMRAMLGQPLPSFILESARKVYNKIEVHNRPTKMKSGIEKGQLASTEYILVEEYRFEKLQSVYLDLVKNEETFGSISIGDLTEKIIDDDFMKFKMVETSEFNDILRLPSNTNSNFRVNIIYSFNNGVVKKETPISTKKHKENSKKSRKKPPRNILE